MWGPHAWSDLRLPGEMAATFVAFWLVFDRLLGVMNIWQCVAVAIVAPPIWYIRRKRKLVAAAKER
jgi:hypothetical protein